jgi:hypothetical protein
MITPSGKKSNAGRRNKERDRKNFTSGYFSAHMSAKSPSIISPKPPNRVMQSFGA